MIAFLLVKYAVKRNMKRRSPSNLKKEYGYTLIIYILMQLSGLAAYPLLFKAGLSMGIEPAVLKEQIPGYWLLASFTIALLLILWILRKNGENSLDRSEPLPVGKSLFWAIFGVFLAMLAQNIAIRIEMMLGIEMGSENTETIIQVIEIVPATMIAAAVVGPILEEIVFRKIIFGSLYRRFGFFLSALISSLIFSVAHMELEHILLYGAMGFTFAFLYVKTKRLIVPIFAHVAMNSLVVMVQYLFADDIERMMKEAEQLQNFIHWLM